MREQASNRTMKLTILQTSDLHGAIFPHAYADLAPEARGLGLIASVIGRERANGGNVLYVDNGDLIQGTPLTYYHARVEQAETASPMAFGLNRIGCDAAVIGNHEFNYGLPYLLRTVKESAFPWLSANLLGEDGKPFFGPPYLVKTFSDGLKVGLLGLTTAYIPHWEREEHIRGIRFADPVEEAARWVPHLRDYEGADVVIVAYHGGFERELDTGEPAEPLTGENQGYALCAEVPGIDVLLTGHQHRLIAGEVNGVCVLQPGSAGAALGKAIVTVEANGSRRRVVHKEALLIAAADGLEADAGLLKQAEAIEAKTQRWLDRPIGRIDGDMTISDPMAARLMEHPLVEFINRVQMDVSGARISCTSLFDNDCKGFPRQVTMRHIVSAYVYPNTLKVIRVTGRDIKAALEQTAEYFALGENGTNIVVSPRFLSPKQQHYNYDMWEGIRYRINMGKPAGSRIDVLSFDGRPLEPDGEYDVVMNNYRAGGGGNYAMFAGKPVVRDIPVEMPELLADYLLERGRVAASADGNWEVVY